nr:hypothetical protein [Tanacetum cinerariifolium]
MSNPLRFEISIDLNGVKKFGRKCGLIKYKPRAITELVDLIEAHNHLYPILELVAFFHLILEMNQIRMKDFADFKCRAFQVLKFKFSDSSSFTKPVHKHGTSDDEIDQVGSGVAGLSSLKGFHQSCRKFALGIWAFPMSSSSDDYACASGAISSFICRSIMEIKIDGLMDGGEGGGGGTCDDPEALGDPEAQDRPASRGGGGG